MKVKIRILICTGLMLNDHSNPYIESTTVLSDGSKNKWDSKLKFNIGFINTKFCMNNIIIIMVT